MTRAARALVVVGAAAAAMAQLPAAWKNWQYSAPIDAGTADASRLVNVAVPSSVTSRAASGWSDVRVIDARGQETPYVLVAQLGGRTEERREARLLEPGVVAGQYSQALLDLGGDGRVHNAATIRIEGQDDLLTWVEIAVSDDRQAWRVVRERAPIYRLQQAGLPDRTTVSYPDSVARFVRLRILDGSRPYRITGADVVREVVTAAERVPADIPLAAAPSDRSLTVWTAASPAIPISEVRFEAAQDAFYRPVSVEASDDGERWSYVASGEIVRATEGGKPRASLAVEFPERGSGHWRVTVHNRSDAPLVGLGATLYTTPRHVVFRQEPGQSYRLLYGNARATAPQYDLARSIDPALVASASRVSLGPAVENATYANPAPWTEQHQVVLWLALGAAVLVLGGLAVRTLRGARGPSR
ncbi:MAG TPA: DUF3999 family protein [Vicinamibacterales bacterium]|nr:DUF3999 family protein [Vicinamibacterales bacterium]